MVEITSKYTVYIVVISPYPWYTALPSRIYAPTRAGKPAATRAPGGSDDQSLDASLHRRLPRRDRAPRCGAERRLPASHHALLGARRIADRGPRPRPHRQD